MLPVDELLNRLEKSAGVVNFVKNFSGHTVRKLQNEQKITSMNSNRWKELPKEIHNAKVDRLKARTGTAAVGMASGAGLGGYKAYQDSNKPPTTTNLHEQNQVTEDNLKSKVASELIERLEKTASNEDGPQLNHHALLSAEGATATAPVGTLLGGLKGATKFGERGPLKGGLGVLGGAAIGTVLGAIPGMEVGGAIGSLLDARELQESRRLQERQNLKEAIKEELREQMGKSAETELLERLEKSAGIFGDIGRATGIAAGRAEKRYNQFASPQGFLQHEPSMGAQEWQLKAEQLKNLSERAGLARDTARSNLVMPGLIAGGIGAAAGSIGLSVHEMNQLQQEALAELQAEQAGQQLQPQGDYEKEASALLDRLEKTAGIKKYLGDVTGINAKKAEKAFKEAKDSIKPEKRADVTVWDYGPATDAMRKSINAKKDKEKAQKVTGIAAAGAVAGGGAVAAGSAIANKKNENQDKTASELLTRLEKTANEDKKDDEQKDSPKKEQQPQGQQQQPAPQPQAQQPEPPVQPEPQQQVPLEAQQPLQEQAPDPRLLMLQQILAEQQATPASVPVEPAVQEVPQEAMAPVPQDPHLELEQLLAEQQQQPQSSPLVAPSMEGYGALENGDVSQENPRQGAGSVSHAPAGVDKTASEDKEGVNTVEDLLTRLEKTAGLPANIIKPIQNKTIDAAGKAGNLLKNPKVQQGAKLGGAAALGSIGTQMVDKATMDKGQEKIAAATTPAEQKAIADKSEKEWINFMHQVENKDGVKAEEKPENQIKCASEEDDMLNGLFKEAAAAIMDMHFPEIRQHVDPMQRITFSK